MGKMKTNPKTVLAMIRLPVDLNEFAGKWAHIWKVDEDTITVKFSESKEVEEIPSVYQESEGGVVRRFEDIENRMREVEKAAFGETKNQNNNLEKLGMRLPGFEPGSEAREAPVMPLDHSRSGLF